MTVYTLGGAIAGRARSDVVAGPARVYPRETVVAEKCEAAVSLGMGNTRMKYFYDLWYLGRTFAFDGQLLVRTLQATFMRRSP